MLAAVAVYTIYGLNVVLCKDLFKTDLISPTALFTVRTGGAAFLFWITSLFLPREKLTFRDWTLMLVASLLCIVIPQYSTLWGLTMSTPYDASLVATLKPVITMLVAFVLGREAFRWNLLAGVILIFAGALVLIINPGASSGGFNTSPQGFLVLLANSISVSFYFVLFKTFVSRHSIVTMMKWMFLFAFIVSVPFSAKGIMLIDYGAVSGVMVTELIFLVVCATFLSYFLMPVGQRYLSATHYSLFSYMQCIVAAFAGVVMGLESIDLQKIVATVLFIAGVWVVRRSR